jgi:type III pantothenate kinase
MFLAIDIGNTNVTVGLMTDEGAVRREWRLTTRREQTSDELHVTMRFLPGFEEIARADWSGAAVCSVAPMLNRSMLRVVRELTGHEPLLLDPTMPLAVRNATDSPADVGMDRLANAVAGVEKHGAPLIVVDFGTATTLDIVSPAREYLGGVILPGIEATIDALHARTAKLPRVQIARPRAAIGRSTVQAMLAGLYFGCVDAVDGARKRIEAELGAPCRLVATGGLAKVVGPDIPNLHAVDEHLTLHGIHSIWRSTVAPA